jgi:hypothetical protein
VNQKGEVSTQATTSKFKYSLVLIMVIMSSAEKISALKHRINMNLMVAELFMITRKSNVPSAQSSPAVII